jgi:hypothetical protein
MEDYEKTFEDFWKELVCKPDGSLNIDQVKRELHDYHTVLSQVSRVYDHITGGRISKPNTLAFEVITQADEHYKELYEEPCEEEK